MFYILDHLFVIGIISGTSGYSAVCIHVYKGKYKLPTFLRAVFFRWLCYRNVCDGILSMILFLSNMMLFLTCILQLLFGVILFREDNILLVKIFMGVNITLAAVFLGLIYYSTKGGMKRINRSKISDVPVPEVN